jgi:hypothetical protein
MKEYTKNTLLEIKEQFNHLNFLLGELIDGLLLDEDEEDEPCE